MLSIEIMFFFSVWRDVFKEVIEEVKRFISESLERLSIWRAEVLEVESKSERNAERRC